MPSVGIRQGLRSSLIPARILTQHLNIDMSTCQRSMLVRDRRLGSHTLDQQHRCPESHAYQQSIGLTLKHPSHPRIIVFRPSLEVGVMQVLITETSEKKCYCHELSQNDSIEKLNESVTVNGHSGLFDDNGSSLLINSAEIETLACRLEWKRV